MRLNVTPLRRRFLCANHLFPQEAYPRGGVGCRPPAVASDYTVVLLSSPPLKESIRRSRPR